MNTCHLQPDLQSASNYLVPSLSKHSLPVAYCKPKRKLSIRNGENGQIVKTAGLQSILAEQGTPIGLVAAYTVLSNIYLQMHVV